MFTGIVQGFFPISNVEKKPGLIHYAVELPEKLMKNAALGASVSVAGVCQTVVKIEERKLWFDAIQETLDRTTIGSLEVGQQMNIERAAKIGDELGGHTLSGHVFGKVEIVRIDEFENNHVVSMRCEPGWVKYLLPKGYVALDGASLTLVDVSAAGIFTVHLIPETLRLSTFGLKKTGAWVNLEFDSQTQAVVDTVERVLGSMRLPGQE